MGNEIKVYIGDDENGLYGVIIDPLIIFKISLPEDYSDITNIYRIEMRAYPYEAYESLDPDRKLDVIDAVAREYYEKVDEVEYMGFGDIKGVKPFDFPSSHLIGEDYDTIASGIIIDLKRGLIFDYNENEEDGSTDITYNNARNSSVKKSPDEMRSALKEAAEYFQNEMTRFLAKSMDDDDFEDDY